MSRSQIDPGNGPPREPTEAMIDAIHSIHRPGWAVSWRTVWVTMYDAWDRERVTDAPLDAARTAFDHLESEARRFADMYPQASDGRNTFVIFADKIVEAASDL